eukprot:10338006-Alexandrium_andersonii.AAC.1
MSASLVGSEMCIRDRPLRVLPRDARPTATLHIQTRSGPSRRQKENSAVSYTHLTLPTICSV